MNDYPTKREDRYRGGRILIILLRGRFIMTDYPTKRQDQHMDDRFKTDYLA